MFNILYKQFVRSDPVVENETVCSPQFVSDFLVLFFFVSAGELKPDVNPNRICGTRQQIQKRIKSAAHFIVNCNIKPNWIPITFDRTLQLLFCF